MSDKLTDTKAEARVAQIEVLKRLGPERRSELAAQWSDEMRQIALQGIRDRHPEFSERRVVLLHALRNAAIPVVTIVGLQFGGLLTGAFIIEAVFAWHGIGELAVQSFAKRDFPMIQGITLVVATTYVLVNLVVDVIYAALDPRITYS